MVGVRWISAATLMMGLVGCSGGSSTSSGLGTAEYQRLLSTTTLYGMYQSEHGGKTPPTEQAFREFIESKSDVLQRINKTPDELLTSPRNGMPLVFVYGKRPPRANGMTYLGYEKSSVDGKRLVIGPRGVYEEIDEAQFKKIFPDAS